MSSKTTLWYVALQDTRVAVSDKPIPGPNRHIMRIRTISANAAGRKYVRDNLPTQLHLEDDGMNEPQDLHTPNPHNDYKPRQEKKYYKRKVKRAALPIVVLK